MVIYCVTGILWWFRELSWWFAGFFSENNRRTSWVTTDSSIKSGRTCWFNGDFNMLIPGHVRFNQPKIRLKLNFILQESSQDTIDPGIFWFDFEHQISCLPTVIHQWFIHVYRWFINIYQLFFNHCLIGLSMPITFYCTDAVYHVHHW